MTFKIKQNLLKIFGLIGVSFFLPIFIMTFSNPNTIKESLEPLIEWKLKAEAQSKVKETKILSEASKEKWKKRLEGFTVKSMLRWNKAKLKFAKFLYAKYVKISTKLIRDIRLFSGVNSLVFLLLLFVSFLKKVRIEQVFLPVILLFISTALCSYFYLFNQNWLYTIVFNDYTGISYLIYLIVIFLFECDIVLNKGRVTDALISGFSRS
ncbi:MAG: Unknown protein [uncultured Sulfurovum sp.]|uniref:Uncharacterized protein n=1 Tax=uncultured Sulfurovum sp. TaxID=269237 RepID=A0A6S6T7R6_9BACT|nr:MAG: Unknown protein [uncultured Sulfurovum sp.]